MPFGRPPGGDLLRLLRYLALQLQPLFEMRLLRHGLMTSSPDRPGDHKRRLDPALSQSAGETADLLDGPADHRRRGAAAMLFGGGAVVFARWRITASSAKASITSET